MEEPHMSTKETNSKKTTKNCHLCQKMLNTWDERLYKTFRSYPTCEECYCKIYDMDKNAFRKRMEDYFGMRPCKGI